MTGLCMMPGRTAHENREHHGGVLLGNEESYGRLDGWIGNGAPTRADLEKAWSKRGTGK